MAQAITELDEEKRNLIKELSRGWIGEKEAEVYVLRESGYTRVEAARALDKKPSTIDSQLQTAESKIAIMRSNVAALEGADE